MFPGKFLTEFAESLRGHDLALVRGTPTLFGSAGHKSYSPAEGPLGEIRGELGIEVEVGDKIYVFEHSAASGRVLREGTLYSDLVGAPS